MHTFRRFLLVFCLLLVFTSVAIPKRYNITYPKPLGPQMDADIRLRYQHEIVDGQAELVLIGDSILNLGVEPAQLAELTGKRTYKIATPGSASALWYLTVKNILAPSPYRPKYIVIVFRDSILTAPAYRVTGKYFELVDELAGDHETVLIQKAYIQQMGPLERLADQYLPVYGSRQQLRGTLEYYIRYTLPGLAGCDPECNDKANLVVFREENLEKNRLVDEIATAESYLYTPERLDFASQVDQSFLPDIIRLTRDNGMQLILVRSKHLNYPTPDSEPLALRQYIQSLKAYAAENGVSVLDFAHDERLTEDLFFDTHHMTEAGASVFTRILAEALMPCLEK